MHRRIVQVFIDLVVAILCGIMLVYKVNFSKEFRTYDRNCLEREEVSLLPLGQFGQGSMECIGL